MLIPPRKHATLERLYTWYGRRLLRSGFARLWIGGGDAIPATRGPLIAAANHSAWWDPIVALFLSHEPFRRDPFGIMEGAQLLRYPFFRRVGAFGVTESTASDVRALAELAVSLLCGRSDRMLWVFPQGALLPRGVPLRFHAGAARIARRCPGAVLIPVAIRYEHARERRPECFVRIGRPIDPSGPAKTVTRAIEDAVREELRLLDADLAARGREGYRVALG